MEHKWKKLTELKQELTELKRFEISSILVSTSTIAGAGLELTKESLQELSKCRNLHKLSLECCVNVDDDTFKRILEGCPKLKYLEVRNNKKHPSYQSMKNKSPNIQQTKNMYHISVEGIIKTYNKFHIISHTGEVLTNLRSPLKQWTLFISAPTRERMWTRNVPPVATQ